MTAIAKHPRAGLHQRRALAAIRVAIGLAWLYLAWKHMDPKWASHFGRALEDVATSTPFGFYRGFLLEAVGPLGQAGAYLLLLSELGAGLGLALGLFTAPAALLGAVVSLNYALVGADLGALVLVAVQVALAFGHAGTTWGLDAAVMGKLPWWFHGVLHHEDREF